MTPHHAPSTEAAEEREAVRPARAWKNKWLAHRAMFDPSAGHFRGPGIVWSVRSYPTRDTAQSAAEEMMEIGRARCIVDPPDYLGAHPVDGQGGGE